MRLLLDTHVLLRGLTNDAGLSVTARRLIQDRAHTVLVSAASIWEIAIKQALGKMAKIDMATLESAIIASAFDILPITFQHAAEVAGLPLHHRDPFDRMLVAQAIAESAHLLTSDIVLKKYGRAVKIV
jgi:PIN domain nuclease of toxin-antitoxin system